MGLIHEDLNAGYYDIKKSISYFEKGDLNNVFQTQTRLCNLYSFKYINHTEINKDVDLAIEYCKKAVSQNDAEAQYLLGQIYCLDEFAIFNFDECFSLTKKSADQNFSYANFYIALLYSLGRGTEIDLIKSHQYFLKAADQGLIQSYGFLAGNYFLGEGVEKDIKKSIYYRELLIKNSNDRNELIQSYSSLKFIYMYEEGYLDEEKAFYYSKLLVNNHEDKDDYYDFAEMLYKGKGTEVNILDAIKYYELANIFGHKLASYNLGDIYYEGNDVDQDYKKAKKYYEVFINLNRDTEKNYIKNYLSLVFFNMGKIYHDNLTNEEDFTLAKQYYEQSFNFGFNYAATYIGEFYYKGIGVEKNIDKAIIWLSKDLDSITLQLLGEIYEYEKKNYKKAFEYYLASAETNYSVGSNNVARFYRDGIYVDRDYEKLLIGMLKTAEQGLAEGAYEIAKLHNKKLLKDSSTDQENYWLDMAYQIDGGESGAAVIKKANELITGANGTKDLDRGIQLLISAIIDDPFSTTELITSFYKEKVINENKFIEIINIIKSKSEKIYYKSSLMILYYQNLIKGEDNNKNF